MIGLETINAPSIDFIVGPGQAMGFKKIVYLEDCLPVGYAPLPDEVAIWRSVAAAQGAVLWPEGLYGDVSWAVARGKRYIKYSGVPAYEYVQPRDLNGLGILEFIRGRPHTLVQDNPRPVLYRKGHDAILVAPEAKNPSTGNVHFQIFLAFGIEHDGPLPLNPGVVFALSALTGAMSGGAPAGARCLVPDIDQGGAKVRVYVKAGPYGCQLGHASIGVQNGTGPDMAAAPVPLLWWAASRA